MRKPTPVFMNVSTVPYRRPADADPFTYRETRPLRYRAEWHTRNSTLVYKSKNCATRDEAVKLARAWLARENTRPSMSQNVLAAMEWTGPRWLDTTPQPERFGYSHSAVTP